MDTLGLAIQDACSGGCTESETSSRRSAKRCDQGSASKRLRSEPRPGPRTHAYGPNTPQIQLEDQSEHAPRLSRSPSATVQHTNESLDVGEGDVPSAGCGYCQQRTAFETELFKQRGEAEHEYILRLRSLSKAARALEFVLRTESESSAAESRRAPSDIERIVARGVESVRQAVERDRRNREGLRDELRSATAAYREILARRDSEGPSQKAQCVSGMVHKEETCNQQQFLQSFAEGLMQQQLAERESHGTALKLMTQRFNEERHSLIMQLHSQSAEIQRLKKCSA